MELTVEQKRQKIATGLKWGLGIVGVIVITPIVFLFIQGLVGLAVAGILGLAIINGAPWLSMKMANWKLQAIKHEASKNPVETLQVVLQEKMGALLNQQKRITEFRTEVSNFENKLDEFKAQFPTEAPKFADTLAKMERLLKVRETRYKQAQSAVDDFRVEIKKGSTEATSSRGYVRRRLPPAHQEGNQLGCRTEQLESSHGRT